MKRIAVASAVALILSASAALAQGMNQGNMPKDHKQSMEGTKDMAGGPSAVAGTHKGKGVVKKSDVARGVVTLDHEPVASMKWPAMTMDFEVADKKLLENVKPGARVQFEFMEKSKGKYVVTKISS